MTAAHRRNFSLLILPLFFSVSAACDRSQKNGNGAAPTTTSGKPCERWISGAQARTIIEGGGLLLDVRTPEEYAQHHLDGALNIEVDQLSAHMADNPKTGTSLSIVRAGGAPSGLRSC